MALGTVRLPSPSAQTTAAATASRAAPYRRRYCRSAPTIRATATVTGNPAEPCRGACSRASSSPGSAPATSCTTPQSRDPRTAASAAEVTAKRRVRSESTAMATRTPTTARDATTFAIDSTTRGRPVSAAGMRRAVSASRSDCRKASTTSPASAVAASASRATSTSRRTRGRGQNDRTPPPPRRRRTASRRRCRGRTNTITVCGHPPDPPRATRAAGIEQEPRNTAAAPWVAWRARPHELEGSPEGRGEEQQR